MRKAKDSFFKVKSQKNYPPLRSAVYEVPTPKTVAKLIERARDIARQLDEVKPLYQELDAITFALVNVRNSIHPKHGINIVDNFEAKNTQFKTVGIRRWEIKWIAK